MIQALKLSLRPIILDGVSKELCNGFFEIVYASVAVPLRRILTEGLFPVGSGQRSDLSTFLTDTIKDEDSSVLQDTTGSHNSVRLYGSTAGDNFNNINKHVIFTDNMTHSRLEKVSRVLVEKSWDRKMALSFLTSVHYSFNKQRRFLKLKDKKIRLRSIAEMQELPLDEMLSLDDFDEQTDTIISRALIIQPKLGLFKHTDTIKKMTTDDGLLAPYHPVKIKKFNVDMSGAKYISELMDNNTIRMAPMIETRNGAGRELIRKSTKKLDPHGKHKYIAECTIEKLESLLDSGDCSLVWSRLYFSKMKSGEYGDEEPEAVILPDTLSSRNYGGSNREISNFQSVIGLDTVYNPDAVNNDIIKEMIATYGYAQTGTKEELIEKVMDLITKQYELAEPTLKKFFKGKKFINIQVTHKSLCEENISDLLLDNDEIEKGAVDWLDASFAGNIIMMFLMKHMRGNRILDAAHENNAYTNKDLAVAVADGRAKIEGCLIPALA